MPCIDGVTMAAYNPHLASDTLPLATLHEDATRRVNAARHLAHLLTSVKLSDINPTDFTRTCEVFDFLLENACDSLAAMETRV